MEGKEAEIHPLKAAAAAAEEAAAGGRPAEGPAAAPEKQGAAKKPVRLSRWRTAAFFLSLFLCLAVVFAFSFVVPCPVRPLSQRRWSRTYAQAAAYGFVEVRDVNSDKVQDVLFAFQAAGVDPKSGSANSSCASQGFASPCAFLVANSGTNGSTLWQRPVAEGLLSLDCSFRHEESPACLLVGKPPFLAALSLETGQTLWQEMDSFSINSTILSPVLKIPDVSGDAEQDLMVFSKEDEKIGISFYSGGHGIQIGSSKSLSVPGMIGHLLQVTKTGANYVLFYTASFLYSYSVEELYHIVVGLLQEKNSGFAEDPHWRLAIDRMTRRVPLLSSGEIRYVIKIPGKSTNNILVARSTMLELVEGQQLKSLWVTDIPPILSEPVLGYYRPDAISLLVECRVSSTRKKLLIIQGSSGSIEWETELLLQPESPRPATLPTADHRSIFLFWGTYQGDSNRTGAWEGREQHLYLFHPSLPNVLLELRNQTEPVAAFQGVLFERGRHACYVLLTGPGAGGAPGQVSLHKQRLKEDIGDSQVIWLNRLAQDSPQSVRDRFLRMRYRSLP